MNLFVEYFSHKNNLRKKEIDLSILNNLSLDFIENYYIFCEKNSIEDCKNLMNNSIKAKIILVNNRCTFQYIFDYSNTINLDNKTINMTLNNDIELPKNIKNININENDFVCLTRWENLNDKHPFSHIKGNSQDVWIWKGTNKIKTANFYFGILGCDNKLAYLAQEIGYNVINPSYTYKSKHNHLTNIRTTSINKKLRISKPYLRIPPHD